MSNLTIANRSSESLNYIIYLQNAILNTDIELNGTSHRKFPWVSIDLDKSVLVELQHVLINIWVDLVKNVRAEDAGTQLINLEILNRVTGDKVKAALEKLKASFLAWWNDPYIGGYNKLNYIDRNLLNKIYDRVKEKLNHSEATISLVIDVVFDVPVFDTIMNSRNYVVIAIAELPDMRLFHDSGYIDERLILKLVEKIYNFLEI
ncbi:hypothetical protein PC41400_07985 [Paenibacillus chitinolyticus]|uniref:Uncharacterized protein n=1 Tax=Paenibacillus chitinolyticus TaxID=79263 RepID=A0A410WSY0_9BACL|nr:hypothetical protein [Paenibacillus chitinolyticus]MCY9588636.1 hypothetical protein [Paenibacillus chitinolyticus]MCY9595860.1 hypothetical protein [Paenibacillus chitinolyticus]QAV17606.1 hypothetical protein PC41400_07985 [Paenibacillus chitinolyticus]